MGLAAPRACTLPTPLLRRLKPRTPHDNTAAPPKQRVDSAQRNGAFQRAPSKCSLLKCRRERAQRKALHGTTRIDACAALPLLHCRHENGSAKRASSLSKQETIAKVHECGGRTVQNVGACAHCVCRQAPPSTRRRGLLRRRKVCAAEQLSVPTAVVRKRPAAPLAGTPPTETSARATCAVQLCRPPQRVLQLPGTRDAHRHAATMRGPEP